MPTSNVTSVGANRADATATWVWRSPVDPGGTVSFAVSRGLREVYLAVGAGGVDRPTAKLAEALRANGIAVAALGGDPGWTLDHDAALRWAERVTAGAPFDGVHLDVEPWVLPDWPQQARRLMDSYAALIATVAARGPLAVDVVPWLADEHRGALAHVVRHCDAITVLAYRDRAQRILTDVRDIQEICRAVGRRYRIGVETQPVGPSLPSGVTFGDDGSAAMARELSSVVSGIDDDLFEGFAVHHLDSWRAMRR